MGQHTAGPGVPAAVVRDHPSRMEVVAPMIKDRIYVYLCLLLLVALEAWLAVAALAK